jgi:hypothetical protein
VTRPYVHRQIGHTQDWVGAKGGGTNPLPGAFSVRGNRQAGEDAKRAQKSDVLVLDQLPEPGRDEQRRERLATVRAAPADEQVEATQGRATARAGGELDLGALGEGARRVCAQRFPLVRCLQAKLRLLQARLRLRKLAFCAREPPLQFAAGLLARDCLKPVLDELDDGVRQGQAASGCVRPQRLLE